MAESAGLTLDNGIAVDEFLQTSDPDIFAAGDCCSFPLAIYGGRRVRLESWRNAQDQGTLAAQQHAGRRRGDLGGAVVLVGSVRSHAADRRTCRRCDATVRRELGDGAFILFHLAPDGRLLAASGIGPGNAVARDIRLAEMLIARQATPDVSRSRLARFPVEETAGGLTAGITKTEQRRPLRTDSAAAGPRW